MTGDNPSSAGNQQERPGIEQWVVGFVDGEGCFSVSIFRNSRTKIGWQVQPEFVVVQGARSVQVLHELEAFFGCGSVTVNRRHDNHREDLYRYVVKRLDELSDRIIPFFEDHPLRTAKTDDFTKFASIVRMMNRRLHLSNEGMTSIAEIVQTMNRRQPSRFLESSETTRQPTLLRQKS
jgi:LAGLIDADG DNA endonuclease family protein